MNPILDVTSLTYNRELYREVAANSLFSVFRSGKQIFDTLKLSDLQKLHENGANINEKDSFGMNFLQRLLVEEFTFREEKQLKGICEWLYKKGIDLNSQDKGGSTALHTAVREENFTMVKWLVDKGASRSIVDIQGNTPYDLCHPFTQGTVSAKYAKRRSEARDILNYK